MRGFTSAISQVPPTVRRRMKLIRSKKNNERVENRLDQPLGARLTSSMSASEEDFFVQPLILMSVFTSQVAASMKL